MQKILDNLNNDDFNICMDGMKNVHKKTQELLVEIMANKEERMARERKEREKNPKAFSRKIQQKLKQELTKIVIEECSKLKAPMTFTLAWIDYLKNAVDLFDCDK